MLTESKKNYAGKVMIQEGKRLKTQKTDIKGLAIKKVNTNKIVREEYTKILEDDILEAEIIDSARAFQDYLALQKRIKDSIQEGNIEFAIPGKVNSLNSYKMPMQQQTVRGSVLWNDLYPNESIVFPDKINLMKLNPMKLSKESSDYEYDIVCSVIENDEQIDDIEKNRLKEVLKSTVYDNEAYAHYGLKVICFPKSIKHLPSWLIPIIDVNTMIENNLSAGTKILKSLSLEVLSYQVGDNTGDVLSNHIVNI